MVTLLKQQRNEEHRYSFSPLNRERRYANIRPVQQFLRLCHPYTDHVHNRNHMAHYAITIPGAAGNEYGGWDVSVCGQHLGEYCDYIYQRWNIVAVMIDDLGVD